MNNFDSICMNMTQAFQALVSIAAKAETVDALLSIKEQLDSMSDSIDSSIDSYNDSVESTTPIVSQTPIDSTNQIDTETSTVTDSSNNSSNDNVDPRKPFDSSAVAYIKKQLTRINIITNSIADNVDGVKRMDKKTKLAFIERANNHYEMLVKFVTDSYRDSDLLETANFQTYVQSKQQILITCYDNVAIGN